MCLMEWDAGSAEWYLVWGKFGTPRDDGGQEEGGSVGGDLEGSGVGHLEEGGEQGTLVGGDVDP